MRIESSGLTQHLVHQSGLSVVNVGHDGHIAQVITKGRGGVGHVGQHSILGQGGDSVCCRSLCNPKGRIISHHTGVTHPNVMLASNSSVEEYS